MIKPKKLLAIHKWLGLISGVLIFIISLSGVLLVFDDEIESWLQRDIMELEASGSPVSVDAAYRTLQKKYPTWEHRIIEIPETTTRPIKAELRRPDERRHLYLDPSEGTILRDLNSERTYSYWMLKLHYQLHAGHFGEILLLLTGLIFLASLITGFWFYRKSVWRVLTFKIRPGFKNWKTSSSQWHRVVGVWSLITNLLMAVTGLLIIIVIVQTNLSGVVSDEIPSSPPVEASVDEIFAEANRHESGLTPTYIRMPVDKDGSVIVYGKTRDDGTLLYEFGNYLLFDRETGDLQDVVYQSDQGAFTQLMNYVYPLHFGDWGGIFIKLLYCFAGLSPSILSITGFMIWWRRSRQRKRYGTSTYVRQPSKPARKPLLQPEMDR